MKLISKLITIVENNNHFMRIYTLLVDEDEIRVILQNFIRNIEFHG